MSSAQFSVRWVHRNPVLVTGFVNTGVDWLAVIFQIIAEGRILSNPMRSVKPRELGLSSDFEWVDRDSESTELEDFWNDILCPAAVSEETELYYTRSRWLSQFPWWPGPLAISDFRALLQSPWLADRFRFRSVVLVPNARMFVSDTYYRRKDNKSYIRLENLEPLVRRYPELCPVDFEELLAQEHTTGKLAAVYAILNRWFEREAADDEHLVLFPYDALARHSYDAVDDLSDMLGLRRRKKVGEALKAVRISYNGLTYQKVPHSPKDPEGWRTTLHPGQVQIIDEVLTRMNCPVEGVASWSLSEEQIARAQAEKARERSRRRRSSSDENEYGAADFRKNDSEPDLDSRIETRSTEERRRRRSSRESGRSRGNSHSRPSEEPLRRRPDEEGEPNTSESA